ncbi:cytochrome P450 [Pilaira anomala]|nr:cytochrome P450 [Pilaira anomala]
MDRVSAFIDSIPRKFEQKEITTPVVSIAAAATLLYSSYKIAKYVKNYSYKKIPSPKGAYPFVGHLLSLGKEPSQTFSEWHKEVGHIMKLRIGAQTWILIDDPKLAYKVFVSNAASSAHRPTSTFSDFYSHGGKGIVFGTPEKHWKEARAAIVSILSPKYVDENYMEPIEKEASILTERLIKYSNQENGVDPILHTHLYSMNIMLTALFSETYHSVEDKEFTTLSASIVKSIVLADPARDIAAIFPIFSIVDYFMGNAKEMKDYVEERDPIYQRHFNDALNKKENNFSKELQKYNFDDETKLVILADIVGAGSDTVSVTLAWVFAILCNHPRAQAKAAREVDRFVELNGHLPAFTERESISYCISLLKECMRFKPVTSAGLPRKISKDIVVDNYLIPKGATIMTNMDSVHMNPDVYSDPHTFYPERFIDNIQLMDNAVKGKLENRDHFGFGWGRRVCPGTYLAEAELLTAFIQVLSKCSIEPIIDSNKREIYPVLDHSMDGGLVSIPPPYKVRFVERTRTTSA